ncbi:MAG: hypothetical protein PUE27_07220 [Sharpea porci]|uniref:hypothetical protein n=1 Tax=Sharpea porci TaxID=2652286 RepID=UPI00240A1F38|nr:hypothetical protein [Sharpea porci]MDD6711853.1 hypothetical protein [Sharpea porci]
MQEEIKNDVHDEIVQWIKTLKFKKKVIGGIDEDDVLKKMDELNSLYEKALLAERARYDALLNVNQSGGNKHED